LKRKLQESSWIVSRYFSFFLREAGTISRRNRIEGELNRGPAPFQFLRELVPASRRKKEKYLETIQELSCNFLFNCYGTRIPYLTRLDKRQLIRIGMDSVLMYVILNYVSLGIDTMRD